MTTLYDSKLVMGASPRIVEGRAKKLLHPAKRGRVNDKFTIDNLTSTFMEGMDNRINTIVTQIATRLTQHQDTMANVFSDPNIRLNDARVNSYGEFLPNQLGQFLPLVLIKPIRGISFLTMPLISFNNSGTQVKYQSYDWNAAFSEVIDSSTSNTPQVAVNPITGQDNIRDFDIAIGITWNEARAVANMMVQTGEIPFDPFVGAIAPLAAKFLALRLAYLLTLDNIAYGGSLTTTAGQSGFNTLIGNDGTNSTNGVPFVNATDILGGTPPSTWEALSVSQKTKIIAGVINNVASVSTTTSSGNFHANVLRMDLNTYLDAGISTNEYKDTSPLAWVIENKLVDAVIPVAAWNQFYPGETTMLAEFCDPQVYFFNVAQPLVQTGVELQGAATKFNYRFRTSGISIVDTLGLTQFQMDFSA